MKKDKDKRRHHESTIGKIIYGFLLFMPLFAIIGTLMYNAFNKNAFETADQETKLLILNNESQYLPNANYEIPLSKIETNLTYHKQTVKFTYSQINIEWQTIIRSLTEEEYIRINSFQIGQLLGNSTNPLYINFYENDTYITQKRIQYTNLPTIYAYITDIKNIPFQGTSWSTTTTSQFDNMSIGRFILTKQNLQNSFYYATEKVEQSNLFNWAKTSMIYTGMLNFTTALNVTNTFMPMLLTYWLIISVIYFLYDIVLIILVVLHRKIHELQESI